MNEKGRGHNLQSPLPCLFSLGYFFSSNYIRATSVNVHLL